ncbi:hypothetical protein V6N13_122038 [Hibiscus sabdariffa]
MAECTFGRRKAESLSVLRKNMYLGSIVSSLIHIPQFWLAVELTASRYGLQNSIDKAMPPATKIEQDQQKKSGELVHVIKADKRRVNFIKSHPHTAALASCGSEDTKLWTPKAIEKAVSPTRIELDQQVQKLVQGRFEYFKRFIDNIEYISCGLELTSSDEE